MYHEEKKGWVKHLDFTLIDLVCLELALILAHAWRFEGAWLFSDTKWARVALLIALVDIVVVFFMESYSGILRRTAFQEFTATVTHSLSVFGGLMAILYAMKQSALYSRQLLFVFLIIDIAAEFVARVIWKRYIRRRMLNDINKSVMHVVCESTTVERCLREITHNKYTDFVVTGVTVVDEDWTGREIQGIPVVANADSFFEYIRTNVVDEVFIDGNTRESSESLAEELVEQGVAVHISLVHTDRMMPDRRLENYANYIVLTTSMKIANNRQTVLKRLMDIIGAIVGLFFTAVFTVIFGPIIKMQSPGPIFYKSVRIGRGGRRFNFYKFRTMIVGADTKLDELQAQNEMHGNMFKMENDPRIIPIGRFMRKYSIDEFPQFLNVLKGDMSLVGTRPPTEAEFEKYEYHHKARLGIKPGLTGMWQVSGRSDITDFEEIVALDTAYITNWTLGLDIQILLKTVVVVFTGKGSK